MSNYLRYFIVFLLFSSLFYSYSVIIEGERLKELIEKKLPFVVQKRGLAVTVKEIEIINISDGIVESKVTSSIKIAFKKKPITINVLTKTIPKLDGSNLSFKIYSFKINSLIQMKKVKGFLKRKIENIKIPIKKLERLSWFTSVKSIAFQDNGALDMRVMLSKVLIFMLIPLFLLHEIGLVLIMFYQKFLSPRKKYMCAKGELYQNGTCSSITKEAFKKDGFIAGIKECIGSTKKCKEAYKVIHKKENRKDGTSCDCSYCGGCNVDSCDILGSSSSACDCGAVPCEIGSC
jgi:putative component of membrane protein insertase Oxa1/YidC/SpoIIIJ protein YidD